MIENQGYNSSKRSSEGKRVLKKLKDHQKTEKSLEKDLQWGEYLIIPFDDESFCSWIIRQSLFFNISPYQFLKAEQSNWENYFGQFTFYNASFERRMVKKESTFLRYANILPISDTFQKALFLRGFTFTIKNHQVSLPEWLMHYNPEFFYDKYLYRRDLAFCPQCWNEKGSKYFKTEWSLAFTIVCPQHGVLLVNSCPYCSSHLFSDYTNRELYSFKADWLEKCWNCGKLYLNEFLTAKADEPLLLIQNQIINNIMSKNYLDYIQDAHLIFGIEWKNNQAFERYISLFQEWAGYERRSVQTNLIAIDLLKLDILKSLDSQKFGYKSHIALNLDTLEFECFVDSCNFPVKSVRSHKRPITGFRNHINEVHLQQKRKQDNYTCSKCQAVFTTEKEYQKHKRVFHRTTWQCRRCKAILYSYGEYQSHYRSHQEEWRCGQCSEIFPSYKEYERHYKLTHKKEWRCGECNAIFDSKKEYLKHYSKIHKTTWSCSQCSETFTAEIERNRHYRNAHPRSWKCGRCDQTFPTKGKYETHRVKMHSKK